MTCKILQSIVLFFIIPVVAFTQAKPELVAPGIISTGGQFGFTLSPAANHALWVQSNGRRDTLIIVESKKEKGRWQKPVPATFSGQATGWKDIDPVFTPDGKTILFQSNRPVPGKPQRQGFDIWAVNKTKKGWGEAYHLGDVINSDSSESYASMASNGNIYFMKNNDDGKSSSDIYVSRKLNGEYQQPENAGYPVNTHFRESNPYISAKEDFLIYFSTDTSGYGEADLFISYNKNGKWTKPVSLGAAINSSIAEFCPFYHQKEKKLYFSRQRKSDGRFVEDIYSIDFNP